MNVCQYNGSAAPFHLPQITVQPQTTQVLYPVYPVSTNLNAHWHTAAASTTILGTTHWLQIRYNPTYCSPSMAWPNFFSGQLTAIWYNYTNIGYTEAIVFDC